MVRRKGPGRVGIYHTVRLQGLAVGGTTLLKCVFNILCVYELDETG